MEEQSAPLLKNYPAVEREAYLGTIASIATVDREATKDEIEFLDALSEAAGLNEGQKQDVITAAKDPLNLRLKAHLDVLRNSDLRFPLITDIIGFARSDNKYTPDEELRIKGIAKYLLIGDEQFNALGQFVESSVRSGGSDKTVTDEEFLNRSGFAEKFRNLGIPTGSIMTGLLGILAPLALGSMFRRRNYGGGLLGGLLGGRRYGYGGGFGSLFSLLSGNRGYGGMNSVLGGLLGRSRW